VSNDHRLRTLMGALTAKERGILVMRHLRDETDEDPNVRATMPSSQAVEFNRYIQLMNVANMDLVMLASLYQEAVNQVDLREGWLFTLLMWQLHAEELSEFIQEHTSELITESEFEARVRERALAFVPLPEIARELTSCNDWPVEHMEDPLRAVVEEHAWNMEEKLWLKRLRDAAAAGLVEARGKGSAARVRVGSVYHWLERPVLLRTDNDSKYEVCPDDKREEVERLRELRRKVLGRVPLREQLTSLVGEDVDEDWPVWDRLAEYMQKTIVDGGARTWQEIRALEMALEEIAAEFEGEDALKPVFREVITDSKRRLQENLEHLRQYVESDIADFEEPTEEQIEWARRIKDRWTKLR
jgi:hypothetical protein